MVLFLVSVMKFEEKVQSAYNQYVTGLAELKEGISDEDTFIKNIKTQYKSIGAYDVSLNDSILKYKLPFPGAIEYVYKNLLPEERPVNMPAALPSLLVTFSPVNLSISFDPYMIPQGNQSNVVWAQDKETGLFYNGENDSVLVRDPKKKIGLYQEGKCSLLVEYSLGSHGREDLVKSINVPFVGRKINGLEGFLSHVGYMGFGSNF